MIEIIKTMNSNRKYLIQREFANYCARKYQNIDNQLKIIWDWIEKNQAWKRFHKSFAEFENDYFILISLIRQVRNSNQLKREAMKTIMKQWDSTISTFNVFSLHMIKAIRKCALQSNIVIALQMLKQSVIYRLINLEQRISRSTMSNESNWTWIAIECFDEQLAEEDVERLDLNASRSFLIRDEVQFVFSIINEKQFEILIEIVKRMMMILFISNLSSKKITIDEDDITDESIIIDDQDVITDESITIDDQDVIIDESITIDDEDAITDENITIDDQDAITDENITIDDQDAITDENIIIDDQDVIADESITIDD